jgi:hypothetical protein
MQTSDFQTWFEPLPRLRGCEFFDIHRGRQRKGVPPMAKQLRGIVPVPSR